MTLKRFLVLGIGNAQVDLLRWLKADGRFLVYALSNTEEGRGREYTDVFALIDITDRESVLEYVRANDIDYIYSVGSDVAMPTVAWVAAQAKLPSLVSANTAEICNHKGKMRDFLSGCYGQVPFQRVVTDVKLPDLSLPWIVKPVDSQGQRGVSTVNALDEWSAAFNFAVGYSRAEEVIVERKIDGSEISVNTFSLDGEVVFNLPSGRESWEQFDGGIIRKHTLPLAMSDRLHENIKRLVEETLNKLNIKNGPAYFQIKIEDDQPYLIEVTPRFDGCHMWRLIRHATGTDLLQACMNLLLDEPVSIGEIASVKPCNLEFLCQPPGQSFDLEQHATNGEYVELYYKPGDSVKRMNGYMEKCGYRIVESNL